MYEPLRLGVGAKTVTMYQYPTLRGRQMKTEEYVLFSIGDLDPHVFGPSGSVSRRSGSGSFSFLIKVLSGLK